VRIEVEPGLPTAAIAPHRLTQVVLNLIHNGSDAIKAARGRFATGRIDISARAENGGVFVGVRDDGCGMAEDVRERCCEPFFTTKTRGQGGTGLGLSMVFGIVANAGGRLSAESVPGQGTEIQIWLPAADARREGDRAPRPAHVTLRDARMRGVVAALLQTLGHRVAAGPPDPDAVLWITDPDSAAPEQASAFLRSDPRRRVVVLGGDEAWARCGAAVQPTRAPVESLRRTLEQASGR
jgi:hypothetical protein